MTEERARSLRKGDVVTIVSGDGDPCVVHSLLYDHDSEDMDGHVAVILEPDTDPDQALLWWAHELELVVGRNLFVQGMKEIKGR